MTYQKTVWTDQEVENPRTYSVQNNEDGTITLFDAFGQITDLGTPVNAENMNKIEEGIYDAQLPSQSGQSGKFLTTNGTNASWGDAAKTNLSNVASNIDFVVEQGSNGNQFYRVWKSRKLEIWGNSAIQSSGTINFIKPYSNTQFSILGILDETTSSSQNAYQLACVVSSKTTTSFKVRWYAGSGKVFNWYSCGQGA